MVWWISDRFWSLDHVNNPTYYNRDQVVIELWFILGRVVRDAIDRHKALGISTEEDESYNAWNRNTYRNRDLLFLAEQHYISCHWYTQQVALWNY